MKETIAYRWAIVWDLLACALVRQRPNCRDPSRICSKPSSQPATRILRLNRLRDSGAVSRRRYKAEQGGIISRALLAAEAQLVHSLTRTIGVCHI